MAPTVLVEYTKQKGLIKRSQEVSVSTMGKSQKISRGSSTGFVPDYRHVVETMGQSEGLGSSGRVEAERTASDDSCAPKRKCISLNVARSGGFGIPVEVISLSKLSRSEKKELELKLKSELEQVRALQKKLPMRPLNAGTLSACSDIRSGSDGHKRAFTGNLQKQSDLLSGQGKKRAPPGRNGHHLKRGTTGRFESVKHAPPTSTSNSKLLKQCDALLRRVMAHQYAWVFNSPVDVVKLNIPDYFTVIKHPMDLGTVLSKIEKGEYSSPLGFLADVRLTFSNAMTYNPPGNDVHVMADQLSKFFEVRWKFIEKKLPVHDSVPVPVQLDVARETVAAKSIPPSKRRKISPTSHEFKIEPVKMADEDKHKLSRDIESLLAELPENIVEFLKKHSYSDSHSGEDEIEVDIDDLSDDTLIALRKLVDDYLREKQANQAKAEPCEIEILNVSGLSNSSMQPCKGNDPVDEDVDIGGNDPPVSSYPPVEIDKDTAHRSSKCSSSSSSSSDSGSSSSDSDSGSSSASESDRARASSPVNATKEVLLGSRETLDQQTNGVVDPHDGNQPVSGLDQVEQSSQPKPLSVEVDSRQEGESAPSERQVSPDKLYRAALLRNRFADTILKAREKTLNQGEKGDPEKLRREREELERQQREEKARLQAEAKAAEAARRQAEAEATAEAKRKRELEREAARQALLEMEKTVIINEGSQFLEDLEMLRTAPAVNIPSSVDEMIEDESQDGMSCFNFEGTSNPLEQLGLFMKVDEDDEEEVDPNSVPEPPSPPPPPPEPPVQNDVEEGEID